MFYLKKEHFLSPKIHLELLLHGASIFPNQMALWISLLFI